MKEKAFIVLSLWMLFQFLLSDVIYAQRKYWFFYGKVVNRVTKQPVSNVNFTVLKSNVGTVSDKKGDFSFYIDTLPSILTVTHVGYQTKKIILDTATFKMTLYLDPVIKQLQEVIISAKPQETVFRDEHYAVLDYEIDSGFVYLLVYRYRFSKAELLCRTPGGDTVSRSGLLSFIPRRLLLDCIGYLHVLSGDTAYQVYRLGNVLKMIHPVTIIKYNEILDDCVASAGDLLYFKRATDYGLGTEFYTINRKDKTRKFISQVRDDKKVKMLRKNPEDIWMLTDPSQPDKDGSSMSESISAVGAANDGLREWTWVKKILYPPLKSFLYRIGEFICVFNLPNRQMEFYDLDGNYSYKIELKTDVEDGKWTYDILSDVTTLKVYTTYLKNGMMNLYEIDLNTGILTKIITCFHPYPQKPRIYENYLYYLYDDPILPDNKMLFRQRL
jgi:hypothetical protein